LVEICIPDDLLASAIGFVDDVNTLAFGESIEETYEVLEIIHEHCLKWMICMVLRLPPQNTPLFTW
jgi:hypothetical protein